MKRAWLLARRFVGTFLPAKIISIQDECWCGTHHLGDYWHDPTHGKVDRDIQDSVNTNFASSDRNQRFIIMLNAQTRRDRGLPI